MKQTLTKLLWGGVTATVRTLTAEQAARPDGWYWTRMSEDDDWEIEEWRYGCWSLPGSDESGHADPPFIGPRIEPPPK